MDLSCLTITGKTLRENFAGAKIYNTEVIRTRDNLVLESGGLAILRENLAPTGAVIKPAAAKPELVKHTGHRTRHRFRQL